MNDNRISCVLGPFVIIIITMMTNVASAWDPDMTVTLSGYTPEWAHVNCPLGVDATVSDGIPYQWMYWTSSPDKPCDWCEWVPGYWPCGDPPPSYCPGFTTVGKYFLNVAVEEFDPYTLQVVDSASDQKVVWVVSTSLSPSSTVVNLEGRRVRVRANLSTGQSPRTGCFLKIEAGGSAPYVEGWSAESGGTRYFVGGSTYWKPAVPSVNNYIDFWLQGAGGASDDCFLQVQYIDPYGTIHPAGCQAPRVNITVKGVWVDIVYCYPEILMYTGNHASETPTQNCVAYGYPPGGTYEWTCSTAYEGMLGIINGQGTDTVTVKGVAPSAMGHKKDAKINVFYTVQGSTVPDTCDVTVVRPYATVHRYGDFDQAQRTRRECFHLVNDQFTRVIEKSGIPCDEQVHLEWGKDTDLTSSATTAWYNARPDPPYAYANWPGGYAILDLLAGWSTNHPPSLYDQKIYVGGWLTTPSFDIHIQPLERGCPIRS